MTAKQSPEDFYLAARPKKSAAPKGTLLVLIRPNLFDDRCALPQQFLKGVVNSIDIAAQLLKGISIRHLVQNQAQQGVSSSRRSL